MRAVDAVSAFQSRSEIRGITDYGVAACVLGTDVADYHFAGGNPNAQVNGRCVSAQPCDIRQFSAQSVERNQLRLGSATRQHRMLFRLHKRRTPERHYGIPDELVDDAVMFLNRESLQTEVAIEQADHE